MLLTYNIANDEITLGFIDGTKLTDTVRVSTDIKRTADEYACIFSGLMNLHQIQPDLLEGIIGASVVPTLTETVRTALEAVIGIRSHILGVGTKTGLNILTDDPTQLGADLVASAVGALQKYQPPMILIDFGTATTFSVLDKNGSFIGCAIAPGVSLSAEALSSGASLLPHFAQTTPKKCIGTNTLESMQSGCIFGSAAMVDGMIERIESELKANVGIIALGKYANTVTSLCAHRIICDNTLPFLGLEQIYRKNSRKKK